MLQFTNCKLTYKKQDLDSIRQKVAKTLRCRPEELKNLKIEKKAWMPGKNRIYFSCIRFLFLWIMKSVF